MLDIYCAGNLGTWNMFILGFKMRSNGDLSGSFAYAFNGETDCVMDSMLDANDKYAKLRGLDNFRNYLNATQLDTSKRVVDGYVISDSGKLAVNPDGYDLSICRRLLAYLLMSDEMDRKLAVFREADTTIGKSPCSADNLHKSAPQFVHANEHAAIPIDPIWSLHLFANGGFRPLHVWY